MLLDISVNVALGSHNDINISTCSKIVTTFCIICCTAEIGAETADATIVKGGSRGVPSALNVSLSATSPEVSIAVVAAPGATGMKLRIIWAAILPALVLLMMP